MVNVDRVAVENASLVYERERNITLEPGEIKRALAQHKDQTQRDVGRSK